LELNQNQSVLELKDDLIYLKAKFLSKDFDINKINQILHHQQQKFQKYRSSFAQKLP
jgi:hypothetical protein